MIRLLLAFSISLILTGIYKENEDKSQWRGPNRDGIYLENNLLKNWPAEGPEMMWSFEGLGYGHGSVAVANDKVFVTGIKDTIESIGTLFTFDLQGNLLWKKEYGKDFSLNFHGTRSTPTIVNDLIYLESGMGELHCINTNSKDLVWSMDFINDLGLDSVIQFGYSESVLIDGDRLFCVPGAKVNNVVALNRFTGELIWSAEGEGEKATYNSPILINHKGTELLIAMTSHSIMGFDANTGEKYWRFEQTQRNDIHANTPVYYDGRIVISSVDPTATSGMVQIELSDDGREVKEVWRNRKFRNLMGGVVRIDTCIIGSAYLKNDWQVISWNSGEKIVQNKELGGGSIIYADGLFYCYAEREGSIALVDAGPEKFEIISTFNVPLGTNEHWARPVIDEGVLYVRHGDALMAYSILNK